MDLSFCFATAFLVFISCNCLRKCWTKVFFLSKVQEIFSSLTDRCVPGVTKQEMFLSRGSHHLSRFLSKQGGSYVRPERTFNRLLMAVEPIRLIMDPYLWMIVAKYGCMCFQILRKVSWHVELVFVSCAENCLTLDPAFLAYSNLNDPSSLYVGKIPVLKIGTWLGAQDSSYETYSIWRPSCPSIKLIQAEIFDQWPLLYN